MANAGATRDSHFNLALGLMLDEVFLWVLEDPGLYTPQR